MTRSTAYEKHPQHRIEIDDERVGLRVTLNGELLAQTTRGLRLREARYPAAVYVPREDVNMERLKVSSHSTHCPFKGDATYFDYFDYFDDNDNTDDNNDDSHQDERQTDVRSVAWSYESPFDQMAAICDHVAFYPDRVRLELLLD